MCTSRWMCFSCTSPRETSVYPTRRQTANSRRASSYARNVQLLFFVVSVICIILGPFETLDETFVDRSVLGWLCTFSSINSGPNKDGRIWRAWTRYPCRPWVDMFCAASVVECGGTKSRVILWARIPLEAPSIYILIFSCRLLLFTRNQLSVVWVHSSSYVWSSCGCEFSLVPRASLYTRFADYLRVSRRKLRDWILIASSVVPSREVTHYALFSVSFSPTISGKKAVKYASLLQTNDILFGYCKCSSAYFWYFLAKIWSVKLTG